MRVQRSISPTKEPGIGTARRELRQWGTGLAARVRQVWARSRDWLRESARDRAWWAKLCLVLGAALVLVVLGGVGYRAQVGRRLARSVQRRLGWGPYAAFVERARPVLPTLSLHLVTSADLELVPSIDQSLALQQQKARRTGILWPQEAHPALAALSVERRASGSEFALEGRPANQSLARVRLAGTRCDGVPPLDHWRPNKWSLELEPSPRVSVLGADAFTLYSPALRPSPAGGLFDGWLYRRELYKAGLVPVPTRLVHLVVNGENWGVYLLEPAFDGGGEAWFEGLDADHQGRLLAHADLWGLDLPGACRRETGAADPALRLLAEDARARAAYKSEAARITQREYVDAMRVVYRRALERAQRVLADEFFSPALAAPWDRLLERQAWLAARADSVGGDGAAAAFEDEVAWPPIFSPETASPPVLVPAQQPSVEEVLERHPFLVRSDRPGFLSVEPGDWRVSGDLILPRGVGLDAGGPFSLSFARGAMLVARGPLIWHAPDDAWIRLLAQEDHWAGVRVLHAGPEAASSWRSVEVRGVRGVQDAAGAAADRAGILFYESPVELERCRVLDSYASTALLVQRASFDIRDCEFGAASGDLVALHAAQGTISRSAFHDALGAAVRLKGSAVEAVDLSVQRVQGEALLAERESRLDLLGLRVDRIAVGVSSAGALARVRDARVARASVVGFLAHAGGRLDLASARFDDDSVRVLAQEGSEAALDGVPIAAQAFDVAELRPPVEPSPAMTPSSVRFGPSIWLVGYDLTTPERAPGETVEVILYWRAFAYLDRQYTIFMHVRDAEGETVAGWDMMPRYNTFPTTDWPLVERIDDAHIVPLSKDLPPGEYIVALGMYDWATGVRLPAYTRSGEMLPEATVILEERVTVN